MASSIKPASQNVVTDFADDRHVRSGRQRRLDGAVASARRLLGNVRGAYTPQAVFKIIRSGGCYNKADLNKQMNYVLGKADHVIDPRYRHDGGKELTARQVSKLASEWTDGWRGKIENGNSMHLMMSYPQGTDIEKVKAITRGVCDELIGQGYGRWNYIVGIHTDKDHPHAHVIVDRRNDENELFYLAKDSELTYDRFKDAMVEWGREVGVEMINTSRFSRGITEEPLSSIDLRKTREGRLIEHGKAPFQHDAKNSPSYYAKLETKDGEVEVWGAGIDRALKSANAQIGQSVSITNRGKEVTSFTNKRGEEVAFTRTQWEVRVTGQVHAQERGDVRKSVDFAASQLAANAEAYRKIGAVADRFGNHIAAEQLGRMAVEIEKISRGETMNQRVGAVSPEAKRDLSDFENSLVSLRATMIEIDRHIGQAPPHLRTEMDKQVEEMRRDIKELLPVAEQRALESPATDSIYSAAIAQQLTEGLAQSDRLQRALAGTGLDADEVAARLANPASDASLESRWVERDMRALADRNGYDMGTPEGLERARDDVSNLYDRVETTLREQVAEVQHEASGRDEVKIPAVTGHEQQVNITANEAREMAANDPGLRLLEPVDNERILPTEENIVALQNFHEQEQREAAIDTDALGDPDRLGELAERDFNRREQEESVSAQKSFDYGSDAERDDYRNLVKQFERTDFARAHIGDQLQKDRAQEQIRSAVGAFDSFAKKSPEHAELASIAWDRADGKVLPGEGIDRYVSHPERAVTELEMRRALWETKEQEERNDAKWQRERAEAIEEAKHLAAKPTLTQDEAKRLMNAVERGFGKDAAFNMELGNTPNIPGMSESQRHDFAASYLRAEQQLGRDHASAIATHNAAAVRHETELRHERRGHERDGHDLG